jgi:hypothetical protein
LLSAQELSLTERLSAPLVHVVVEAGAGGEHPLAATQARDWLGDLQRLGFGLTAPGDAASERGPRALALDLLLHLLGASSAGTGWDQLELAWTGVRAREGAPNQPLLVFRARLAPEAVARLRELLEGGRVAHPLRTIGNRQVFELAVPLLRGPGSMVELVLVGADLLITNHGPAIDEVLDESGARRGLAADPAYRSLRQQIGVTTGAIAVFADFARLRRTVAALNEGDVDWFLRSSGLAAVHRAMLAVRPAGDAVRTSVLLECDSAPDGWLALVERLPMAELARRVPAGGLGGVAMALEPSKLLLEEIGDVAGRSGLRALRSGLTGSLSRLGLDLDRQVLGRLGRMCAVELYAEAAEPPQAVLALQTANREGARRLFSECKQALATSPAVTVRKGPRGAEELVVPTTGDDRVHLTVVEDSIALAFQDRAIEYALKSAAALSRGDRQRVEREIAAAIEFLGAGEREGVAGVFRFDLTRLAPQPGTSPLLRRHAGYLAVESRMLHLEVWTEQ